MSGVIQVFLVGDNRAMIDKLNQVLSDREGIVVIGQASSITKDLAGMNKHSPDVIIMLTDTGIPGKEILDAIRALDEAHLLARVILMADHPVRYLGVAIKTGMAGLLPRNTSHDNLVSAIRKIYLWSLVAG